MANHMNDKHGSIWDRAKQVDMDALGIEDEAPASVSSPLASESGPELEFDPDVFDDLITRWIVARKKTFASTIENEEFQELMDFLRLGLVLRTNSIKERALAEKTEALKRLLEDPLANNEPEFHYVRCHEEYLDSDNGPGECQIPQSDQHGVAQDDEDELWAGFECCGKDFKKRDKICFSGAHTTNEDEVVYYGAMPVDEGDEFFAHNKNVIPCDKKGCDVD